jgi:hypothetical protein
MKQVLIRGHGQIKASGAETCRGHTARTGGGHGQSRAPLNWCRTVTRRYGCGLQPQVTALPVIW